MRKITFILAMMVTFSAVGTYAQGAKYDDLEKMAMGFVPKGSELVHKLITGKFAESAAKDSSEKVVLLYKANESDSYEGSILFPQGFEAFDNYRLPKPEFTWSIMEPIAVFFENVDKDADKELLILEKCMTGIGPTGARYFYRTRVYDWDGSDFRHLEWVSDKIGNANTAAKVRAALPGIIKGQNWSGPRESMITPNSIGLVKYGMTISEVRKAVSPWTLERTSDGEGVALIAVKQRDDLMMTIYAGEEDPEAGINDDARVELVETSNPYYKTAKGITANMDLSEVEKAYGDVTQVTISEIEAREYAEFQNQPAGIYFRVLGRDGNAGNYASGKSSAARYEPGAYVFSIISDGRASQQDAVTIEIPAGSTTAIAPGFLKEKGDRQAYVVNAQAGYRMTATITDVETPDVEGPVMVGYVKSPDGLEEGNPGGLFFDQILTESGKYMIVVKQNEAKSGSANIKFKLKITLVKKTGSGAESDSFKVLDIAAMNTKIDTAAGQNAEWVKDPFQVLGYIVEPFSEMSSRKIEMTSRYADVADKVSVTVIDDGYADDSVRGEKFVYELEINDSGVWKVVSAKKAQVCWKNRGHQDYSTAPCL